MLYLGVNCEAGKSLRKRKENRDFAKFDWMDIEKQRGISTSIVALDYDGKRVNIPDNTRHE